MAFLIGVIVVIVLWTVIPRRLKRILEANANWTAKKLEDPKKMLDYAVTQMEKQLDKAEDNLVDMVINRKKIEKNIASIRETLVRLVSQIKANMEDKGRACTLIALRLENEKWLNLSETQLEKQNKHIEIMKRNVLNLRAKIELAKTRKNLLLSRANCAISTVEIMKGLDIDESLFDKVEDEVEEREFHSEALEEVSEPEVYDMRVEQEYERLRVAS